jgi:hypothetical protein
MIFKPPARCAILTLPFLFLPTTFGQNLSDTTLRLVSARLAEAQKKGERSSCVFKLDLTI